MSQTHQEVMPHTYGWRCDRQMLCHDVTLHTFAARKSSRIPSSVESVDDDSDMRETCLDMYARDIDVYIHTSVYNLENKQMRYVTRVVHGRHVHRTLVRISEVCHTRHAS